MMAFCPEGVDMNAFAGRMVLSRRQGCQRRIRKCGEGDDFGGMRKFCRTDKMPVRVTTLQEVSNGFQQRERVPPFRASCSIGCRFGITAISASWTTSCG